MENHDCRIDKIIKTLEQDIKLIVKENNNSENVVVLAEKLENFFPDVKDSSNDYPFLNKKIGEII